MRTPTVVLVAQLAAAAAVMAQGQDAPPQFRAGVELITLDVAVLDQKRQPVRGLTAADFTVLDEGIARPIRAFTAVELAGPARTEGVWERSTPPDVVTNQSADREGRLVVIVLDRSIPVERAAFDARTIAAAAVDALGANDLAAVVSTSNRAVQNFTTDRARLLRAISDEVGSAISPEQEAVFGKVDPLSDGSCLCGLCVLDTITRVADAVRDATRRRKVMFFIGNNIIYQSMRPVAASSSDPGCENRLKDARTLMFTALDRANLTVHAIDPRGLRSVGPHTSAGAPGGFDRPVNSGPAVRLQQQKDATAALQTSQQSLEVLTERTGGRLVVNRNDADQVVAPIFGESDGYYVLGIERAASERPDAARKIEVKVARRGARVFAQRQYVAATPAPVRVPATATSAAAEAALDSLLPRGGVPLAMAVTTFANRENPAKPIVRVSVDALGFAPADGRPVPLDVVVKAVDPTGKPVASARQTSTVRIAGSANRPPDLTLQSHLELSPGEYGIRVAIANPATGQVASVFSDVTVPRFASEALSLSDLAVELGRGAAAPAASTTRIFRRGDTARVLMQIYQGSARTEPALPAAVRVQILDAKGAAVRDQTLPFGPEAFASRQVDCVVTLPLAHLTAGVYLLKLDASMNQRTATRALRFAVE